MDQARCCGLSLASGDMLIGVWNIAISVYHTELLDQSLSLHVEQYEQLGCSLPNVRQICLPAVFLQRLTCYGCQQKTVAENHDLYLLLSDPID